MTSTIARPTAPTVQAGFWATLRTRRFFAPTAIGVFAFLLSEVGNWVPSVWYDETATITSATRSWAQLVAEVQNVDAVHAAYYAFMHLVFDVVGYSPFTLRLPSAIAVGLTAALIVVLVRLLSRPRLAALAGILFALLPRTTWMGGEGRSYAAAATFATLLTLVLVGALRSPRRRWWVVYGALAVVSCLVFVYLGFIVIGHAAVVIAWRVRDPGARPVIRRWAAAVAVAAVALSPFALLVKSERSQVSWIDPLTLDTARQVYETQWFWGTAVLPALGWLLMIAGGVRLLRGSRADRLLGAIAVPAVVLPTVALVVISLVYVPVYSPRYLAISVPFVAILMAAALDAIAWRWARILAVVVIVGCIVPHLVLAQRIPTAKQDSTWSSVAALIAQRRSELVPQSRTAVLYGTVGNHRTATARVVEYAYPAAFEGTIDPTLLTPAADTGELWETHASVESVLAGRPDGFQGARTAFLITGTPRDTAAATSAALVARGWHVVTSRVLGEMRVVEYSRD